MANSALHASIGMAIAKLLPIWWLSLPLAFLSHFIMDLYPEASVHQYNYYKKENRFFVITQILLMIFVILIGILSHNIFIIIAAVLANLPDMWDAVNVIAKRKKIWFCHGGNFPVKVAFKDWQGFSMKPFQNALLDTIFVTLILLLIFL